MKVRRRTAVALLAVAALAIPSGAFASDTRPAQDSVEVETPMAVSAFDADVAAAHGYELRQDAQGRFVTVKVGEPIESGTVLPAGLPGTPSTEAAGGVVSPMGVQTGNCGTSFVYITNPRSLTYRVRTGFSVSPSAISYSWMTTVTGPGYYGAKPSSGFLLARPTWTDQYDVKIAANQRGSYFVVTNGTATLTNGVICAAMTPTDISDIF